MTRLFRRAVQGVQPGVEQPGRSQGPPPGLRQREEAAQDDGGCSWRGGGGGGRRRRRLTRPPKPRPLDSDGAHQRRCTPATVHWWWLRGGFRVCTVAGDFIQREEGVVAAVNRWADSRRPPCGCVSTVERLALFILCRQVHCELRGTTRLVHALPNFQHQVEHATDRCGNVANR